jgi:Flp pilus assembly protein TadD
VLSKQDLDRSEAAFRQYLERETKEDEPTPANAHWRLGMIYEMRRDKGMARAEYEAALALEPDHKQAKKALRKIKRR